MSEDDRVRAFCEQCALGRDAMKAYDRGADAGDKGVERYRSDVVPTESGTVETAGPKSVIERARLELARVSVKQTSEMTRALRRA